MTDLQMMLKCKEKTPTPGTDQNYCQSLISSTHKEMVSINVLLTSAEDFRE